MWLQTFMMRQYRVLLTLILLLLVVVTTVVASPVTHSHQHRRAGPARAGANYMPVSYAIAPTPLIEGLVQYFPGDPLTLDSANRILTLDYGAEVSGFPFVEISEVGAPGTQIRLQYSEPWNGLNQLFADGPFLWVNGLMNSFRTETFNFTGPETTTSFFIQGGQRWQTITLLAGTSITIKNVGFKLSVDITPIDNLPGSFSTSNAVYKDVWSLGAYSLETACVDAKSQPSTWEVSGEGALIRGQYPGVSALGVGFGSYTMSFSTKIVHGGTGWRVAGGANGGYGPYFVLVSSGPQLASADLNLLPGNSLVAGFGFSIINQTILGSAPPQYFNLPITIVDNQWYKITTEIMSTGYNITIRGPNNVNANVFVLSAPFQSYVNTSWGSPTLVDGTFGFGPFIDQIAYYKNVSVVDANSTALYNNALTTDEVYAEYSVQTNPRAVCIDGAKRDRMVWIGDFVHTARMIATSTGRFDFIQSMIDFEFEWQFLDGPAAGLVAIQAPMGAGPQYKESYYPSEYNEDDYFIFFLVTIGDYFALTGDTALLGQHWNDTKFLVDTLTKRYIGSSGLLTNGNWFTAQGTDSATAPTALFAIALNQLVHVANALNDSATASSYITLSQELNAAINSHLWSPSLGAYSLSVPWAGDTSILATAFTIRAGIADTTKATTGILKLSDLFYQIGYKDSTRVSNGAYTQLSPNVQGFLLESLFLAHTKLDVPAAVVTPIIKTLVEVFWPKMVKQNQFYTGASWEYLYPDGSPGIGIFTSLNHPWGGAPTYVLTDYVLGLRRDFNATTQAYNWVMDPAWDIVNLLGLTSAQGKVPLLGGGYIEASWSAVTANGELSATRINATVTGAEGVEVLVKRQK